MNCEEIREILSAELDGEALDNELIEAYQHLPGCPGCRAWRRECLVIKRDIPLWGSEAVPREVEDRLRQADQRAAQRGALRQKRAYLVPRPLAWAAAVVLTLQIGWASYTLVVQSPAPPTASASDVPERIVLTPNERVFTTMIVQANDGQTGREAREH